jgi:hypothetical protein
LLAKKTVQKFTINIKDPSTVNYDKILEYVKQQTESDQSVKDLELARGASSTVQKRTELVDLIRQLRPTVSVTKEQQLAEPVVKSTKSETVVD